MKGPKNEQIQIDREAPCPVDPALLPPDVQFKGVIPVIVQDLALRTDNVRFLKEKWYAPSTGQTYLAALPQGYDGQFSPHLKRLVWLLANVGQMSQPKILEVVRAAGIQISSGHLGQLLLQQPGLDAEATAVADASLGATPWQQVDHTATRVNRDDQQCHILATPLDDRIAKTRAKRTELLQVLAHPELPLHNNAAELGCRARVRRREVSFGPRTEAGVHAWDVGLTLVATAKKLGANIYYYIQDRISGRNEFPSLADLITQRAQELNLGASWATS